MESQAGGVRKRSMALLFDISIEFVTQNRPYCIGSGTKHRVSCLASMPRYT